MSCPSYEKPATAIAPMDPPKINPVYLDIKDARSWESLAPVDIDQQREEQRMDVEHMEIEGIDEESDVAKWKISRRSMKTMFA